MKANSLSALFFTIILAGCANRAPIQGFSKAAGPMPISMSPLVEMPANINYVTFGQTAGMAIGGLVGAMVTSSLTAPDADTQIVNYLGEQKYKYGDICVIAIQDRIAKDKNFKLVEPGDGNTLKMTVLDYGLNHIKSFKEDDSKMKVVMAIRLDLVNPSGKVLWSKESSANHRQPRGYLVEEYLKDKQKLDAEFQDACADMSDRLIKNLNAKLQ